MKSTSELDAIRSPDRGRDGSAIRADRSGEATDVAATAEASQRIGTLRRELLDRTIIWNQHQLERLVVDYIDHTHKVATARDVVNPRGTRCHRTGSQA